MTLDNNWNQEIKDIREPWSNKHLWGHLTRLWLLRWILMLLIAHRGNINGPNPLRGKPSRLYSLYNRKGYNVEVDFWYLENTWVLGHDEPEYEVSDNMLGTFKSRFACWYHYKN